MAIDLGFHGVPAGSVGPVELADSAVDLAGTKVKGQLPGTRIADGAVDASKTTRTVRKNPHLVDHTQVSATGTTPQMVKTLTFNKRQSGDPVTHIGFSATLWTSNGASAANLDILIDSETSPRAGASVSTVSTVEDEVGSTDIDITDLANGKHEAKVRLWSAGAADTANSQQFEFYTVVGP